jgi:HD-GYP domain-containing protein (c-di-GMP phosphodiesterase class II)
MDKSSSKPLSPMLAASKVAGVYLGGSLIWAIFSDGAIRSAGLPPNVAGTLQVYYVAGFVLASASLIYLTVRSYADWLQKLNDERMRDGVEVAQRLAMAIELRDSHTSGHNHRLGRYCQILADEMALPQGVCDNIYQAAALHDVGKIGVPDDILNKPGELTADERQVINSHVELGASLLAVGSHPLMQLAHSIALTHHERWDGRGYPRGLKGREIPIEGRIAAVCDVFDALMSARPYKRPWSLEESLTELIRHRGTRFDPDVVDAFIRAIDRVDRVMDEAEPTGWHGGEERLRAATFRIPNPV